MKRSCRFAALVCFSFLLCAVCGPLCAAQVTSGTTLNTVRVGWFLSQGAQSTDADGVRTGYCYDYYQEIARYAGIRYEYVPGTWSECLERLEKGEIDVLSYVQRTPERSAIFDFVSTPIGQSYAVLTTLATNRTISDNTYRTFDGMHVGAIHGSAQIAQLQTLMAERGFTCTLREYSKESEMVSALQRGEIDLLLCNSFRRLTEHERVVAQFSPTRVYLAVTRGNTLLRDRLEDALSTLAIYDPGLSARLMDQYFSSNARKALILTPAEKRFLKNAGTLRIAGPPMPGTARFDQNGKPQGFTIALLDKLSGALGFDYTYEETPFPGYSGFDAQTCALRYDVLCNFNYDYGLAERAHVTMSTPYFSMPYYRILNKAAKSVSVSPSVAAVRGLRFSDTFVSQQFAAEQIVWYDSELACLEAVRNGAQTMTFCNTYNAEYYLTDYRYSRLMTTLVPLHSDICFATPTQSAAPLASILSKGLAYLGPDTINELLLENTPYRNGASSLQRLLVEYPTQSALVLAGVLLFILALTVWLAVTNYRLRRTRLQLEIRSQEYHLAVKNFTNYLFQVDLSKHVMYFEHDDPLLGVPAVVENLPDGFLALPLLEDASKQAFSAAYAAMQAGAQSAQAELQCKTLMGDDACFNLTMARMVRHDKEEWAVGTLEDIYQQRLREQVLARKAEVDAVTGLLNRGAAQKHIERTLAARPEGGALLLFDLDNFKAVNDTLGHSAGDTLLQSFSGVLRKCFRSSDIIGRFGGDEFIVMLPQLTRGTLVLQKAAFALDQIEQLRLGTGDGPTVSASVGIAFAPQHGTDFPTLYMAADIALYEAKRSGKNQFSVYDPSTMDAVETTAAVVH